MALVVDEIDDNHVRQIAIPLLKDRAVQNHINELALEANKKRYEAYCLEQEALRIMNEEVILAKWDGLHCQAMALVSGKHVQQVWLLQIL